jgi:hypothetical protein
VEKQTVLDRKLPYDRDVRGCCLRAVSLWKKIPIILVNKAVDEKKRKGSEEEVKNLGLPTYKNIFFLSVTPFFQLFFLCPPPMYVTGMTGKTCTCNEWPLTGSFLKENIFFVTDQTPLPYPTRVSPPSFDTGTRNGVLCGSQQSQ